MTALRLDPNDGRDIPLRLPRHEVGRYAEPPAQPNPHADLLDDVIRRMSDDYAGQVAAKAEVLANLGLGLEEVEHTVATDEFVGNGEMRVTLRGTYRIVPLPDKETPMNPPSYENHPNVEWITEDDCVVTGPFGQTNVFRHPQGHWACSFDDRDAVKSDDSAQAIRLAFIAMGVTG